MRNEKKYILKNVLTADSIENRGSWCFDQNDNKVMCSDCLSPLFYVAKTWGVVEEEGEFSIVGYHKKKKYIVLRELGIAMYCAECGAFNDDFDTWVYPEKKTIATWQDDGLDYADRGEIETAIASYNKTGKIHMHYISSAVKVLQDKLAEFEKANGYDKVKPKIKKKPQIRGSRKTKRNLKKNDKTKRNTGNASAGKNNKRGSS